MTADLDTRLLALVSSDDPQDWIDVGCDLADAERFREAESCFRRAEHLGHEYAAFNLGNALTAQRRWAEAVVAYDRALALGVTDAWLNLGLALLELDDPGGATHAFERSAAAGDLGGMLELAFELRAQGERDRALSVAVRAAEAGHRMAIGVVACWRWCTTLDPSLEPELRAGAAYFASARLDLAELLVATGRVAEGRAQLELGARPGRPEYWIRLGNLACDQGDPVAAEAAYRAGIAGGDNHCRHNLGTLLCDLDRCDEAVDLFRAGAELGDALAAQALADHLDNDY